MKHNLKMDEITTKKREKMAIQCSIIKASTEGIFTETPAADEKQDLSLTAKAASICWLLEDKEKTLKEYYNILNLEKENKAI